MAMEGSSELKPFVQPPAPKTLRQSEIVPDPSLAAGQQLPTRLRTGTSNRVSPDQIGVPLQDPDPAYDGFDTFIVLTDRRGTIARFSAHRAMSIFTPSNPVRLSAISIIHHWLFTAVIVLVILGNYWTRQMLGVHHDHNEARWRWTVTISEVLFLSACVFELSLKFIAYGVAVGPFTSMRSLWAWLDLLFIITGILMIWWPTAKLFRLVAALRTLKIIPVTRILARGWRTLLRTKERLFDLLIYSVLVIVAFALVGQSTYGGLLRQKCVERMDSGQHFGVAETEAWNRNPRHWLSAQGPDHAEEFFVCGNETRLCPNESTHICLAGYGTNPNYGYTFYDNFGWAALLTVRIIAQDAVDGLYMQIPVSSSLQQLLYFLAVFFIGTWAIVGFGFAVTASVLEEEAEVDELKAKKGRRDEGDNEEAPQAPLGACRSWAYRVVNSPTFDKFIIVVSVIVLILFALHWHGMDEQMPHPPSFWFRRIGLTITLSVYVLEAWLQLFADGPRRFACNPLHVYESLMGKIIIVTFFKWYAWDFGVSVLDTVLFTLPVVKLAIRWRALRTLGRVARAMLCIPYFWLGALAILVLGEVGTLLLVQNYRDRANLDYFPNGVYPRWNFGDLSHAWLMVARVTCGEWAHGLYECLRVGNVTCLLYFMATLFIMYLILMHVNISIVRVAVGELERQAGKDKNTENDHDGESRGQNRGQDPERGGEAKKGFLGKFGTKKQVHWLAGGSTKAANAGRKRRAQVQNYEDGAEAAGSVVDGRQASAPGPKGLHIPQSGCFVGFQDSLADIYSHYAFRAVSIANILLSTAALATDDVYINEKSGHDLRIATRVINIIFVVILVIEIVVKLIAFGLSGFAKSGECLLDLLMLAERIWSFFWFRFSTESHLNAISGLRPLMLVFRVKAVYAPARALVGQVWALKGYLLSSAVVWLLFVLVGHQIYAGKFYKCLDEHGVAVDHRIVHGLHECQVSNYTWVQSRFNFDDEGQAPIAFFSIATFTGRSWRTVVEDAVDARGVDLQPVREHGGMYAYGFFVIFIVLGVLLLGNTLLGVLVYEFRARGMLERLMTKDQVEARKDMENGGENDDEEADANTVTVNYNTGIPRPSSVILEPFYDFLDSPPFEPILVTVLALDLCVYVLYIILGHMSPHVLWIVFFWIFTFLYTAELAVKALGWRCHMLRAYPNLLDIVAVTLSFIVGVFCFNLTVWGLRIALRGVFLLKYVPFTLKHVSGGSARPRSILLNAATRVTPIVSNLVALLVVLMAAFALIGMAEFKHVMHGQGLSPPANPLNFQTFCNSMLVMIQLSMVAGWDSVYAYIGNQMDCDDPDPAYNKPGTCGNWRLAFWFIFVYTLISILVVTNMFLVLVLEAVDQLRVRQGADGKRTSTMVMKSGGGRNGARGVQNGRERDSEGTQLQTMVASPPRTANSTSTGGGAEVAQNGGGDTDLQSPQQPPRGSPRESVVTVNENGENPEAVVVVPT